MIDAQTPGEPPPEANRHRCLAAFVPVLLLAFRIAHAQSPPVERPLKPPVVDSIARPVFAGLYLGYSIDNHFTQVTDEISCGLGSFSEGTASTIAGGLFFDFPFIFGPTVRVISRFSTGTTTATLPGTYFRFQYLRDLPGDSTVEDVAETLTELDVGLRATTMTIGLTYEPAELRGVRVGLSGTATVLAKVSERRSERFLSPVDARFGAGGAPVRELPIESPLAFRTMVYGAEFTIGHRLRAGRRLSFFPQIMVSYSFSSIAENAPWNVLQVMPMLGVGWELTPDPEPVVILPPPVQPRDTTPVVHTPVLTAHIVAKGVDAAGREYDDPAIEIEEAQWVEVVPILPAVFFDSASAEIPGRYLRLGGTDEASRFSVDSLVNVTPIDIHWQILNIIGGRLRADKRLAATIVGTGSGDENAEANGLAIGRATGVARYLQKVWGIDSSRLHIETSGRPIVPSSEERSEGREENRRVEFRFTRSTATDPVLIHRLAAVASPPAVKFNTDITADTALADWNVTVVQGEKELLRFEGNSGAGSLEQSKLWPLTDLRINRDLTPIRYRLQVTDILGQFASDSGIFRVTERVKQREGDSSGGRVELYGYNLVGFDYDSAELLPRQLAEISEIARAASGQAQMTIIGYTDRVGDPERNRLLSLARAQAVRDAIRGEQRRLGIPEAQAVSVQGVGQQQEIFDNDLPEGRILSRMAVVTISKLRSK